MFFSDSIVLIATSKEELQKILEVEAEYGKRWKIKFNANKCGVLVVGQKKQNYFWTGEKIADVDEYKYLGVR